MFTLAIWYIKENNIVALKSFGIILQNQWSKVTVWYFHPRLFYSYISFVNNFDSYDIETYVERGSVLNWQDYGNFEHQTQIKMTQTISTDSLLKNQSFAQVKGPHLLWLFNGFSIWCYVLSININNPLNFAHTNWYNDILI